MVFLRIAPDLYFTEAFRLTSYQSYARHPQHSLYVLSDVFRIAIDAYMSAAMSRRESITYTTRKTL